MTERRQPRRSFGSRQLLSTNEVPVPHARADSGFDMSSMHGSALSSAATSLQVTPVRTAHPGASTRQHPAPESRPQLAAPTTSQSSLPRLTPGRKSITSTPDSKDRVGLRPTQSAQASRKQLFGSPPKPSLTSAPAPGESPLFGASGASVARGGARMAWGVAVPGQPTLSSKNMPRSAGKPSAMLFQHTQAKPARIVSSLTRNASSSASSVGSAGAAGRSGPRASVNGLRRISEQFASSESAPNGAGSTAQRRSRAAGLQASAPAHLLAMEALGSERDASSAAESSAALGSLDASVASDAHATAAFASLGNTGQCSSVPLSATMGSQITALTDSEPDAETPHDAFAEQGQPTATAAAAAAAGGITPDDAALLGASGPLFDSMDDSLMSRRGKGKLLLNVDGIGFGDSTRGLDASDDSYEQSSLAAKRGLALAVETGDGDTVTPTAAAEIQQAGAQVASGTDAYAIARAREQRARDLRVSVNGTIRMGDIQVSKTGLSAVAPAPLVTMDSLGSHSGTLTHKEALEIARAARPAGRTRSIADELILLDPLGRGASGSVKRALHLPTMQLTAVKLVRIHDDSRRLEMSAELKTLYANMVPLENSPAHDRQSSTSPNLVKLFDAYSVPTNGAVAIVIEYMSGGSWEDLIQRGGVQDEELLRSMAFQALSGLAWLHERRHIHRDIKPGNILTTLDLHTHKLADFGIARQLEGTIDAAHTWVGTMLYMAPERIASGAEGYKYAADVWSLGLSLAAVAAGRFPYQHTGYWDMARAIRDDPPPLDALRGPVGMPPKAGQPDERPMAPAYSAGLFDFLTKCLLKDPEQRPSARELLSHPWVSAAKFRGDTQARLGSTITRAQAAALAAGDDDTPSSASGPPSRPLPSPPPRQAPGAGSKDSSGSPMQSAMSSAATMNRRLADLREVIAQVLDSKWPDYVRLYRRRASSLLKHSMSKRVKDNYTLDEAAFNEQLDAKRVQEQGLNESQCTHLTRRIHRTASSTARSSQRPSKWMGIMQRMSSAHLAASLSGLANGDALAQLDSMSPSAAGSGSASLASAGPVSTTGHTAGGAGGPVHAWRTVNDADHLERVSSGSEYDSDDSALSDESAVLERLGPDNFKEVQVSRSDVSILAKQLGIPSMIVQEYFNAAVSSKLHGHTVAHAWRQMQSQSHPKSGTVRRSAAAQRGSVLATESRPPSGSNPALPGRSPIITQGALAHAGANVPTPPSSGRRPSQVRLRLKGMQAAMNIRDEG